MPGLPSQRNDDYQFSNNATTTTTSSYSLSSCSNGSSVSNPTGFWSKHRDDVSFNQLQKFWSELSPQARQVLLKIDKQTLFEQARKNMYCSRCNGLLLEGFLQIVMYGKSLQQEGGGGQLPCNRLGASKNQKDDELCMTIGCHDDVQDPSVHPWGGLTTTRDGTLTLLDCYLYAKSLKGLQNVFDSARARERERELLYPDACGGGGRGWISQGMVGYGRGHGTRETCALHTARLSVDTLVDFWSALGEETRQSLLRMKEEDFIERLMYRFDSKRFCRDCRRNVIREFKELKELKRMRREPRCTSWFCVADTGFQYELTLDTVQADWHQTFIDAFGTYHHFEWAVGTGEGKSDILEFENVGLSARVQVNGLDLTGLNSCYITLRAWKMDGRCTELSVKAHALKGQQCVHCRLVVGDGFVTITRGESIRRFFEHAEEAEEEEDDDSMDKDGNELDGECSRPQKHAKSPELAREFLLDAATVIFKEQVEKAFREGTARQNAHSIFVSLALKLLEERVHVACKEIITLEKQMKLLEEEEKEKREEEERKERRRAKEREKKLRRKERLRGKGKEREKKCSQSNQISVADIPEEESAPSVDEEPNISGNLDLLSETGEEAVSCMSVSVDVQDEQSLNGYINSEDNPNGAFGSEKDGNGSFAIDHSKYSRRRLKFWKEYQLDQTSKWSDRRRFAVVSESGGMVSKSEPRYHGDGFETSSRSSFNGLNKQLRSNSTRSNIRTSGPKYGERLYCSHNRMNDRYDSHPCSCYQNNDYRAKVGKSEPDLDVLKPYYRGNKYNQVEYVRENGGRPKSKIITGNSASSRDSPYTKKVWEPMETQKKYPRSNSDSDVTLRSTCKVEASEPSKLNESCNGMNSIETNHEDIDSKESRNSNSGVDRNCQNGFHVKSPKYSKVAVDDEVEACDATISSLSGTTDPSVSSNSNSDSCSSCLSEGDGNTSSSSNPQNPESSSTSDSEDAVQHSEEKETSVCLQNGISECYEVEKKRNVDGGETLRTESPGNLPSKAAQNYETGHSQANILPPLRPQSIHFPLFQAPSVGYYHQGPVSWPAPPANGLMPVPHPNHYVFASPFGYSLNGNSHFMPYNVRTLPHLTPPLINPGQVPIYQPVPQINGIKAKEHPKIPNLENGGQNGNVEKMQRAAPTGQHPSEPLPNVGGEHENSEKGQMGNAGFSLFHFGGPVALSTGYNFDTVPPKEGITGGLSSKKSADHTEGDRACSKKDGIEEYNLFAASNGIRFSFF